MKRVIQFAVAALTVGPLIVLCWALALVVGRKRAVAIVGPRATAMARRMVATSLPVVSDRTQFDAFRTRAVRRMAWWKPFLDFTVRRNDADVLQLHVTGCAFTELCHRCRLPDLGGHICQGDWEVARERSDQWDFSRSCQIGTGGAYCDHTYRRLSGGGGG